jgi:hypothetical protein
MRKLMTVCEQDTAARTVGGAIIETALAHVTCGLHAPVLLQSM